MSDVSARMPVPAAAPLSLDDDTLIDELVTVRDYLRLAVSVFNAHDLYYGHGTDSAWDEAVALVLGALRLPHDVDPAIIDARVLRIERARIITLLRARTVERRPLPYLLGESFYAGVAFNVDERVLIPRSPIAELIESGFDLWFEERDPAHMLDLCTGSGCIGIAAALMMPTTHVMLSDLSEDAIDVARSNITRHDVGDRVKAVAGDLFAPVAGQRFDLIVSNPPYVDAGDLSGMPAEFNHEPTLALGAGHDGLDLVRRMLREAREYLTDDGVLIVEVGNSERHVIETWPEVPFLWLEFARGGHGVFALTSAQLEEWATVLSR
ncbi:50S ribosomal protein L3 N(5)-glutamine methyltransferase [uncultured Kushneria sp.]|uniref:50S ribosomal protein L3 N(5)-glutamine methyltransferase n=1 Tax=uncultured Kushneria sp. TaxID=905033 RepID=UPI0026313347|nr:50S ribosomal protein L3 N(5)-glutamine methyltransferase [uncultured Kushneria sp.]